MQAQTSRKWRADDPRRLRMAETRAAILRAARPIMLRDGLGGTTLDRVAAEGGIAKMTLYRHFPSKEALFEGLVTATCESMREGLENAPTADTDKPIANRLADELRAFTSAQLKICFAWVGSKPGSRVVATRDSCCSHRDRRGHWRSRNGRCDIVK